MIVKKLNENNDDNRFWKFEVDNMFYYGVRRSDGFTDIFDAYGKLLPSHTYVVLIEGGEKHKKIEYKDLPREVVDALKNNQKEMMGQAINDLDKQKNDKTYSDMNQAELNNHLNNAIDSKDFDKAKEISSYMRESVKTVKYFKNFINENNE